MSAAPEHDHPTPPGKTGLRAVWLGSRRVAVLAAVIGVGVLTGAGVAVSLLQQGFHRFFGAAPGANSSRPSPTRKHAQQPAGRRPAKGRRPAFRCCNDTFS